MVAAFVVLMIPACLEPAWMSQSSTKATAQDIYVSTEYLAPGDRVIIIDDFLAGGTTADALVRICRMAVSALRFEHARHFFVHGVLRVWLGRGPAWWAAVSSSRKSRTRVAHTSPAIRSPWRLALAIDKLP